MNRAANLEMALAEEWVQRRSRNSQYSLRAFARDIGLGKTILADVLAGKRKLSNKSAQHVTSQLGIVNLSEKLNRESMPLIEADFSKISDWHYLAILTLPKLKNHKATPEWISERLGISVSEAREALRVLSLLGLIKVRNSRIVRTGEPIRYHSNDPQGSVSIRKYHRQNLRRAEVSLEHDSPESRVFGSLLIPVGGKKFKQNFKKVEALVDQFKHDLADLLGQGVQADTVYLANVQVFPTVRSSK